MSTSSGPKGASPSTLATHIRHASVGTFLALSLAASGCGEADAQGVEDVTLFDLPSAGEDEWGIWQSNTEGAPWFRYRGGARLRIEHALGRVPRIVLLYVSFSEEGIDPDTGATAGLAAGDMARILEVSDQTVTVHNDTNANMFARMVLH
ncbi:MAG: hypothetical protein AAF355_02565 [Myxococcota bacterium]